MSLLRTVAAVNIALMAMDHQLGSAQSTVCRGADLTSQILIENVAQYTSASTSPQTSVRDSLRLPSVPANQVTLVTHELTCVKARDAYNAALPRGTSPFSGRVYVISTGNRFVVLDPDYHYSAAGNWSIVVFDSNWKKLSVYS
jgi:hypothetical protein